MANELTFAEQMVAEQEEKDLKILSVIGYTEPSTFSELCNGLRTLAICPEKGDKTGWSVLFRKLGEFKTGNLVAIVMEGRNMKLFQLTQLGADKVRAYSERQRGLFQVQEEEDDTPP